MDNAIQILIFTKDALVIDAKFQIYRNNVYGTCGIDPVWDATRKNEEQVINLEDESDPTVVKIMDIVTKRMKEDIIYYRNEFERLGIELKETDTNPLTQE